MHIMGPDFVSLTDYISVSGRPRIALLPFWALFWAINPFCNRDFLKSPFFMLKLPISALFWRFSALFCNQISVLHTFSSQFWPKLSSTMSNFLHFRRHAPIFPNLSAVCQSPQTSNVGLLLPFKCAVPNMALASIDPGYWPNPLFFGLSEYHFPLETPLFSSQFSPFLGLK